MVQGSGRVRGEINVTPLVDVVLVLLIIFMVVTPLTQTGYEVQVPSERKTPLPVPVRDQLIVRLDGAGRAFLNQEQIPRADFPRRLRRAVDERAGAAVFFAADGGLPYAEVAAFLDLCRASGATNLGIVFEDLTDSSAGV